uniref:Uncharacterized protein n=1 Tax=Mycena chlorophos TaxID=658473 RepID=A0ABQ0L8G8_MYCCL|nr:predicted protein [Mycena chlorophos]
MSATPAPELPPLVQVLPDLDGARINRSQFTVQYGDTHNYPAPSVAQTHLNRHPLVELHEYELLCKSLVHSGRGRPLLRPTQDDNDYPPAYRQIGISIGDVGCINSELGCFAFDFNVYRDGSHPINSPNRAPHDFRPVSEPRISDNFNPPGSHVVSTQTVEAIQLDAGPGFSPRYGLQFNCVGLTGAFIALPNGSAVQRLKSTEPLRKHIIQHGGTWYTHLTEGVGQSLENDSFYVVTQCEKACVGGLGTFQIPEERPFQLTFGPEVHPNGTVMSAWISSKAHFIHSRILGYTSH